MRIAVLGLGEAGSIYARGLAESGAEAVGFDPHVGHLPTGVSRAPTLLAAVDGADLVLSLVGARAAADVLEAALPAMAPNALYADLNTAAPDLKRAMANRAADAGVPFADVAVMAPVPRAGIRTELFASGPGATAVAAALVGLGVPVSVVGSQPGDAAALKLVRSVFMKGLAALAFESLSAAEKLGTSTEARAQIAAELGADGDALVQRLLDGTRQHAARREHEMIDARGMLAALGTPTWMTDGTLAWLRELQQGDS